MQKLIILFLVTLFLLIGCFVPEPRLDDNAYELEQSSAVVGDTIEVICKGGNSCKTTTWGLSHSVRGQFSGVKTGNNIYSEWSIIVTSGDFNETSCSFTVPPKAISSDSFFGKALFIEYPKVLTLAKSENKVTVTSEKAFFNIDTFSKEKAKLLLDDGYPLVWLNGSAPNTKMRNFEDMSPLTGSSFYDLETITPYQVTFTIPDWVENGSIHILNENGYLISEWDFTPLGNVKIEATDFNEILTKINEEDKTFIQNNYHEKDGVYYLNENIPTGKKSGDNRNETYRNIKRILRRSGYYDTHVLNIEPDPLDPDAFLTSKEKLVIK